ncbi:hypothetical protein C8F01DRAFT_1193572 [Mycena amicta]|nr:hypothetical protein C8F01DRAFT_1193572 [Mycena amicta]
MQAATPSAPLFDVTNTFGALEIGVLGSFALFGLTTAQSYVYYARFQRDPLFLRLLVAFVWLCELAHTICIGNVLYDYTITNYGNPRIVAARILPTMSISVVLSGVITALVQGFFAFRIWTLGRSHSSTGISLFRIIPILLWISEFVYLVASTAATVLAFGQANLPQFLVHYGWLMLSAWVLNLVNDTTITASLVVLLVFNRTRGLHTTTALMDKLIKWTIETGLITSMFSILNLVFVRCPPMSCLILFHLAHQYVRNRHSFIWLGIQFIKARLFANSLLASLNSRSSLREMDDSGTRGSSFGWPSKPKRPTGALGMTSTTVSFTPVEEYASTSERTQCGSGSGSLGTGRGLGLDSAYSESKV